MIKEIQEVKAFKTQDGIYMMYLREFENDCPEIAKEYFDLKYEKINKYLSI